MMNSRGTQALVLCCIAGFLLAAGSCSTGPTPPAKGTPAFYWTAARETFAAADYTKTNEHLDQLCRTENEYTVRAQPWKLILTAGMAKGHMELADRFELGARANRANPTPFRKHMSQYRISAGQLALQAGESMHKFQQTSKDPKVTLDFSYPTGSAAEIVELNKIGQGIVVQPAEVEAIEKKAVQRAVLLTTCSAVGAKDDTAKTHELFKAGNVQVSRETFLLAMAETLFDLSKLFSRDKLDQPQRMKLLCDEALEALKQVPESKRTKDLRARIEKALKAAKLA